MCGRIQGVYVNTLLSAQQFCKSKTALGVPGNLVVMNLPAKQETWVLSLGQEDHLEKEMETHFGILAREIPWTEELGRLQSMGSQKSRT